jgi:hypothetical protein
VVDAVIDAGDEAVVQRGVGDPAALFVLDQQAETVFQFGVDHGTEPRGRQTVSVVVGEETFVLDQRAGVRIVHQAMDPFAAGGEQLAFGREHVPGLDQGAVQGHGAGRIGAGTVQPDQSAVDGQDDLPVVPGHAARHRKPGRFAPGPHRGIQPHAGDHALLRKPDPALPVFRQAVDHVHRQAVVAADVFDQAAVLLQVQQADLARGEEDRAVIAPVRDVGPGGGDVDAGTGRHVQRLRRTVAQPEQAVVVGAEEHAAVGPGLEEGHPLAAVAERIPAPALDGRRRCVVGPVQTGDVMEALADDDQCAAFGGGHQAEDAAPVGFASQGLAVPAEQAAERVEIDRAVDFDEVADVAEVELVLGQLIADRAVDHRAPAVALEVAELVGGTDPEAGRVHRASSWMCITRTRELFGVSCRVQRTPSYSSRPMPPPT